MHYSYTVCDICSNEIPEDKTNSKKDYIDCIYLTTTSENKCADVCSECMTSLNIVIGKIQSSYKANENKKKVPARYFAMKKK